MDNPTDGWAEYQRLVLAELERHGAQLTALETKLNERLGEIRVEIATLKVKAGVWGALSGMIPVILGTIGVLMARMFGAK